jgi:hypothetical protein
METEIETNFRSHFSYYQREVTIAIPITEPSSLPRQYGLLKYGSSNIVSVCPRSCSTAFS